MNRLIPHLIFALVALVFATVSNAALYNIKGTDYYVNGLPPSLTVTERAKLITAPVTMTEKSCMALKCSMLDKAKAKTKIKELIKLENEGTPIPAKCPDGMIGTPPNCSTPPAPSLMPIVDVSKYMLPATGFSTLRLLPTTEIAPPSGGDFRIGCGVSHMNNDDPIIYPNQQGRAHSHLFFGNTSVDYKSDLSNLASVGNSTCGGGIMNRSAYWIPNIINTETGAPVIPSGNILVYYKNGFIDGSLIKAPPKGLRMIAGNMYAKTAAETRQTGFKCHPGPNSKRDNWPQTASITPPSGCEVGDDLTFFVEFPQCWDGKNLDSPSHYDHMANPVWSDLNNKWSCPSSHPVAIPAIGFNVHFIIKAGDKIDKWRLSSDNYQWDGKNAGYSAHGDYVEGWDRTLIEGIIKNCINGKKDAHAHLLCDGREFY